MGGLREWQVTRAGATSGEGGMVVEGEADQNLEASFIAQDFGAISRSLDSML